MPSYSPREATTTNSTSTSSAAKAKNKPSKPGNQNQEPIIQNPTINLLFICSRNQWRSPTAETLFRQQAGYATRSRGTSKKAVRYLSPKDLQWADLIFVMERKHAQRLRAEHPEATRYKKPIVLGIPDEYRYMDPTLLERLHTTVTPVLSEFEKP